MATALLAPLISIIPPVLMIIIIFIVFGDVLFQIISILIDLLSLLKHIWEPEVFIKELIFGIYLGIIMVFTTLIDTIKGYVQAIVKKSGISDNIFGLSVGGNNSTSKIYIKYCKKNIKEDECNTIKYITDSEEIKLKELIIDEIKNVSSYYRFHNKNSPKYYDDSDTFWKEMGIGDDSKKDIKQFYLDYYKEPNKIDIINASRIEIYMPNENSALWVQYLIKYDKRFKILMYKNVEIKLSVYPLESSVVCAKTTFFQYIILVLCPPLYIFLRKGITGGWHYIVIDIILTLLFYFPGLIYALLITFNPIDDNWK